MRPEAFEISVVQWPYIKTNSPHDQVLVGREELCCPTSKRQD